MHRVKGLLSTATTMKSAAGLTPSWLCRTGHLERRADLKDILEDGLQDLHIYANGALIQRIAYPDGPSDGPWVISWQPERLGDHTIVAELRDLHHQVYSDTIRITLAQATSVPLTVTLAGDGSGRVSSVPAGIDCVTTCSSQFDQGATITLTAMAAPDSVFVGWDGACSGSAPACTVVMSEARAVTAIFSGQPAERWAVYLPLLRRN